MNSPNTAAQFQKFYNEIWSDLKDNPFCQTETSRAFVMWLNIKGDTDSSNNDSNIDILKLLKSEKYRFEIADKMSENNVDLAHKLGMSERTVYRLREKYKL